MKMGENPFFYILGNFKFREEKVKKAPRYKRVH